MACHPSSQQNVITLQRLDDSKTVEVMKGDIIQLVLEAAGGTGYTWILDEQYSRILELIGEQAITVDKPGVTGAPVVKKWRFRATNKGTALLALHLYRPWESKELSIDAFKVTIIVQ